MKFEDCKTLRDLKDYYDNNPPTTVDDIITKLGDYPICHVCLKRVMSVESLLSKSGDGWNVCEKCRSKVIDVNNERI